MADQAVDGPFGFLAGTLGTVNVVPGMAGIAAGEGSLAGVAADRRFFQPVHDVVAVAERVDTVVHAVFLLGVGALDGVRGRAVLPVHSIQELGGLAGVTVLAGLGAFVAVLLDEGFSGMFGRGGRSGFGDLAPGGRQARQKKGRGKRKN